MFEVIVRRARASGKVVWRPAPRWARGPLGSNPLALNGLFLRSQFAGFGLQEIQHQSIRFDSIEPRRRYDFYFPRQSFRCKWRVHAACLIKPDSPDRRWSIGCANHFRLIWGRSNATCD